MKSFLHFLTYFVFLNAANSQQWQIMGDSTVSDRDGDLTFITVDNSGIPTIAYRDLRTSSLGATVKRFDGSYWILVGNGGFSNGNIGDVTIAFDNNNIPYVVFTVENYGTVVMKFDGNNWVRVGPSTPIASGTLNSLAIDKNGTPYIAFRDQGNNYKANVMRFDGSNWTFVGQQGFSQGGVGYPSISIDNNGIPYIAFWDMSDIYNQPPYKAAVMKFDGSNWVMVGQSGFAAWNSYNHPMAFDSNNNLYFVGSLSGQTTLMKFNGNNWNSVGGAVAQGSTGDNFLLLNKNDVPYIAFTDGANGKANVKKFNGINWVNVGNPDFSPSQCFYLTLALGNNGEVYTAFEDGTPHHFYYNNNYITYYPAIAMMFKEQAAAVNETKNNSLLSVYPNPAKNTITVKFAPANAMPDGRQAAQATLKISNSLGATVYSEIVKENTNSFTKEINGSTTLTINVAALPKGIYFVELLQGKNRAEQKFVVE